MFDKYHPGYFGKVGMRYFNYKKNKYHCPIINLDKVRCLGRRSEGVSGRSARQPGMCGRQQECAWRSKGAGAETAWRVGRGGTPSRPATCGVMAWSMDAAAMEQQHSFSKKQP